MLVDGGHEVHLHTISNHEISRASDKLRLLWETAYNPRREDEIGEVISAFGPDVMHVHNFFPLFTPAVHVAAARRGVAVVQTLHNYRLFCAAATFERKGKVCELCLAGSRMNALRHRCYRGSLPATAALVHMQSLNERKQILAQHVDRFIALTQFARDKFIDGGLPSEKIVVKPNFIDRPSPSWKDTDQGREGALFVGRLSPEKGIETLLDAWKAFPETTLNIAGDGPLRLDLERLAPPNVKFLGRITIDEVHNQMSKATFLVLPSLCYEGFPMSILEAFHNGIPVITSRLGSMQEIVEHGKNGLLFEAGNVGQLANEIAKMIASPDRRRAMGRNAQREFAARYTKERNLKMLEEIYLQAIERRAATMSN